MITWILLLVYLVALSALGLLIWTFSDRLYKSSSSVASAYDAWTNDKLLENLWGEHIHLGYYSSTHKQTDFRQAKIDFVHHTLVISC